MSFGIPVRNGLAIGLLSSTFLSTRRALPPPTLTLNFLAGAPLDSRITFTRAGPGLATFVDSSGVLQTAAIDAPRFDHDPVTLAPLGLLIESQRTNSIRNSTGVGSVSGSPGTLPTNWTAATTASGITREILGTGTEDGVPYIDIRYSGTPTASIPINVAFEALNFITASSGQTWTESLYLKLQAGSFVGTQTTLSLLGNDGTIGLENFQSANITSTPANLVASRLSLTATLANVLTTNVQPRLRISTTISVPFDITLRIGLSQLELGGFATSVIPTTTAQVTRIADAAVMTGTNFSSWYNQTEGTIVWNANTFSTAAVNAVVNINNGTSTNRIYGYFTATSAIGIVTVTTEQVSFNSGVLSGGPLGTTAFAYSLNNFAQATRGVLQTPDFIGLVPTVSQMNIGTSHASTQNLNGHVRTITYYPQRLADAQLRALSA